MTLSDDVLLAFRRRDAQTLHGSWATGSCRRIAGMPVADGADLVVTFGDAARHICVLGQTGTGKTSGVIRPALRRLLEKGCSGLVLDAKGEFSHLHKEFPERVVPIGGGAQCQPFNILEGMPVSVFREWLSQNRPPARDGYWGATAIDDAALVLQYYRARGLSPTLSSVINALLDAAGFVEEFEPWVRSVRTLPAELYSAVRMQQCNAFGILSLGGSSLVDYDARRGDGGSKAQEQYTWQLQHVLPGMRAAVADPRIQRGLCSQAEFDLTDLVYAERKVLLLDLPETQFGAAAPLLTRLLMARFIATILGYPHHDRDGYGKDKYTFFCADEYQHYLHLNSSGIAGGMHDDTSAFDRLRSLGHIQLVSTQSVSALRARRPATESPAAVDCLLANVGTVISFGNNDPETFRHVSGRLSRAVRASTEDLIAGGLRRGEAVVVAGDLARSAGPIVATVRTGGVANSPWMGHYIHHGVRDADPERYAAPAQSEVANPFGAGAERWIAQAEERFSIARERLLEFVEDGGWVEEDTPVVRTSLSLGRFDADFSLRVDPAAPLEARLRVRGLGFICEGSDLEFPLRALHEVAQDFPESALTDVAEAIPLEAYAESGVLSLERAFLQGPRLTLAWDGVGRFTIDLEHWRILAWAALRYRTLLLDALAARAEQVGEVSL